MQDQDSRNVPPATGDDLEACIGRQFSCLDDFSEQAAGLVFAGRFLTTECLVGSFANPVHLTISAGRITAVATGPALMRSWRFAYRATPQAWAEYWQPIPRP